MDNESNAEPSRSKRVKSVVRYPAGALKPEDFLRFIQLGSFEHDWKHLGMNDDDLQALEVLIMMAPTRNPIVPGTGGLRKMRFARSRSDRGKRGGLRVCYAHFPQWSVVTLLVVYGKDESDDLSPGEKRSIKGLIEEIDVLLEQGA